MVYDFLRKAKEFLGGSNGEQSEPDTNYRDRDVRPATEDPYGDPAEQYYGNAIPASEDPYGDPADQYANAIPASQDPYGDPADQYGDVRPASEDPYGDPADEYNR